MIPFAYLDEPSIESVKPKKTVKNIEESKEEDWRKVIVYYLEGLVLPDDRGKAKKVKVRATRYVMVLGKLYWMSFFGPSQKCLNKGKCKIILREIHEG